LSDAAACKSPRGVCRNFPIGSPRPGPVRFGGYRAAWCWKDPLDGIVNLVEPARLLAASAARAGAYHRADLCDLPDKWPKPVPDSGVVARSTRFGYGGVQRTQGVPVREEAFVSRHLPNRLQGFAALLVLFRCKLKGRDLQPSVGRYREQDSRPSDNRAQWTNRGPLQFALSAGSLSRSWSMLALIEALGQYVRPRTRRYSPDLRVVRTIIGRGGLPEAGGCSAADPHGHHTEGPSPHLARGAVPNAVSVCVGRGL
jgi:hypothetical protein